MMLSYSTPNFRYIFRFLGLAQQDLLRISQVAGFYQRHEITPKGKRYLQVFAEIEDDLRPDLSGGANRKFH
jgi:hypothetical protein